MAQIETLARQIDALDPVQREELIFALSERVFPLRKPVSELLQQINVPPHPSIIATPGVCGGAARLIRTRVAVWTLERMRQRGVSEIDILRSYPTLRAADLVQAWSYADHHRDEIEAVIRENEQD